MPRSSRTITSRCFRNELAEHPANGTDLGDPRGTDPLFQKSDHDLHADANNVLKTYRNRLLDACGTPDAAQRNHANVDESVYTGAPGTACALSVLSKHEDARAEEGDRKLSKVLMTSARQLLAGDPDAKREIRGKRRRTEPGTKLTWLDYMREVCRDPRDQALASSMQCGLAGNLFVEVACLGSGGEEGKKAGDLVREYLQIPCEVCDCDEWLYGRTGYLFGLLYFRGRQEEFSALQDPIANRIHECVRVMHRSGVAESSRRRGGNRFPKLMYAWLGEDYIGAAHGLAGIYAMILSSAEVLLSAGSGKTEEAVAILNDVFDSFAWLLENGKVNTGASDPGNGNFPAVLGEKETHLVHFCHGACGFLIACAASLKACENVVALSAALAGKARAMSGVFLSEVVRLGGMVWNHGLLLKGPGLCHGIAGNGHALLIAARALAFHGPEPGASSMWIRRAAHFANMLEVCERNEHTRGPDHPFSLWEGIAGTCLFLDDLETVTRKISNGDPADAGVLRECLGQVRFPMFDV